MPGVIGTDLTVIAQAVEQQLLGFVSPITGLPVCGDISNIYWVEEGTAPPAGITGQRDVILYELDDDFEGSESSTVVGSGRGAAIKSGMRVALRTTMAADRTNTRRDWFIAHRPLINGLLDSLMDFFPVDANQNALTIEGFVVTRNRTPERARDTTTWGFTVSSYQFHYTPNISSVTP